MKRYYDADIMALMQCQPVTVHIFGLTLQGIWHTSGPTYHAYPPSRYYVNNYSLGILLMYDRPSRKWYAHRSEKCKAQPYAQVVRYLCRDIERMTGESVQFVGSNFLYYAVDYGVSDAVQMKLTMGNRYVR